MPAATDTSEMKKMYGEVMRSNCTVRSNFSASLRKPGALIYTRMGAATMPISVTANRISASMVVT